MIARRGFLSALLGSPFVAAAANQAAGTTPAPHAGAVGECFPEPSPPSAAEQALRAAFNRHEDESLGYVAEIPPDIAAMKSWSDAFKQSVARKRWLETQRARRLIQDVFYSNDPVAVRAARLAKLGVDLAAPP